MELALNSLLVDLSNRGFHVQAYANDVAILVTGTNMLWIKGRAQKALNIANNWAHNQELQFSSKKTEIVLFTNKRKPDSGTLHLNGRQLEISKEATLLGVNLTWKVYTYLETSHNTNSSQGDCCVITMQTNSGQSVGVKSN